MRITRHNASLGGSLSVLRGVDSVVAAEALVTMGRLAQGTDRKVQKNMRMVERILDDFCCGCSTLSESQVETISSGFVDAYAGSIIEAAMASNPEIARQLVSEEFLISLSSMDRYIGSGLLFEMRITGNIKDLKDPRLFTQDAIKFLGAIGPEAASQWLDAIGRTGNVADLTSSEAMSDDVIRTIRNNGKLASDLSFTIGELGASEILKKDFLEGLKELDPLIAAELLSAIWCNQDKVAEITSRTVVDGIIKGDLGVWTDVVRLDHGSGQAPLRVVISKPGDDTHDRSLKMIIKSLREAGVEVIYTGGITDPREIASIAIREGAHAVGFGIMDDAHRGMVIEAGNMLRSQGHGDVAIFGGGMISPKSSRRLIRAGVEVFGLGSVPADVVNFVMESTHRNIGRRYSLGFEGAGGGNVAISLSASSVSGHMADFYQPTMACALTSWQASMLTQDSSWTGIGQYGTGASLHTTILSPYRKALKLAAQDTPVTGKYVAYPATTEAQYGGMLVHTASDLAVSPVVNSGGVTAACAPFHANTDGNITSSISGVRLEHDNEGTYGKEKAGKMMSVNVGIVYANSAKAPYAVACLDSPNGFESTGAQNACSTAISGAAPLKLAAREHMQVYTVQETKGNGIGTADLGRTCWIGDNARDRPSYGTSALEPGSGPTSWALSSIRMLTQDVIGNPLLTAHKALPAFKVAKLTFSSKGRDARPMHEPMPCYCSCHA